jgi:putative Mg2+ transporter-C (MgtC) family protein
MVYRAGAFNLSPFMLKFIMEWFNYNDLLKIVLAALIGAAIGFEREAHGQAAGLRTYVLVSIGACLMMLLSIHMEELFRLSGKYERVINIDPGRIASYAIASMGFLGAGAIIKGKGSVKGLTTAAGLWLVTGIGLTIGAGFIIPAVFAAVISLLFLVGLRRIKITMPRTEFIILTVRYSGPQSPLEKIKEILTAYTQMTLHFVNYAYELKDNTAVYRIRLSHRKPVIFEEILVKLRDIKCIEEVRWEESDIP